MTNNQPEISIVVPIYNSSMIIPELVARIEATMRGASFTYELLLTDDCSTDNSWKVISKLSEQNDHIIGLRLSKNSGQWIATLAGISRASGKYIVTIDDDLEYEPAEIPKLYAAIIANEFYVVFGMSKEKYRLQGKNKIASNWRRNVVYKLWNSPVTESFRIFRRDLVFDGDGFIPTTYLDAFIIHAIDKRFIGYEEVKFNRRFAGKSNISLLKKIQLFILFSFHFSHYRTNFILIFILIFLFSMIWACIYTFNHTQANFVQFFESILLLFGFLNLYYLSTIFRNVKNWPLYLIIETSRRR